MPTPARYPDTSRRWALVSGTVGAGLVLVALFGLGQQIRAYDAGYAAARPGASATVVRSDHYRRGPDIVEVAWVDDHGGVHQRRLAGASAATFRLGTTVPVRVSATDPDVMFPEDRDRIDETRPWTVGLIAVLTLAGLTALLWTPQAVRWWRAATVTGQPARARIRYSYGKGALLAIPWVVTTVDGQEWHQRVMWEPWVAALGPSAAVTVRRSGRALVVDVPGYGRLWPSGRARRRSPRGETDQAPATARYRMSRVPVAVGFGALILVAGVGLVGWFAAVGLAGLVWLLILYVGGAAAPVPGLAPRSYPRLGRSGGPGAGRPKVHRGRS